MKGFTKCENGHYYKEELSSCPYCHGANRPIVIDENQRQAEVTELYTAPNEEEKTRLVVPKTPEQQSPPRTVFGDDVMRGKGADAVVERQYRDARKLVGWLVTYSFDPMGADFRIYEGRNSIGRDMDCNITVPDRMISGKHATILFKNGVFKITDELSSHGTLVNDKDIEDEHVVIKDNDVIKMGETIFKFKVAVL
jgi:hypothetical protein